MTQKIIQLGIANQGNGDPLRVAFGKVNDNFTELYNQVAAGVVVDTVPPTTPGEGDLWWDPESGRLYVSYDSTWVDASPVDGAGISSTNELVNGVHTVSLGSDGNLSVPDRITFSDESWQSTAFVGHAYSLKNNPTGSLYVTLDDSGTINTPLLLPITFTAVLDSAHKTGDPLTLTDTPWEFTVQFQVNPDGSVETMMNSIFPNLVNPGYTTADQFSFTEADHGIPGYTFELELDNLVLAGPAGWTASPVVSIPPEYPSTVASLGAIKLTANEESLVFGTDGSLTLPPTGTLLAGTINFNGTLQIGNQSQTQYQFEAIVDEGGPNPVYYSKLSLPNIAEIFAGEDLSLSTWGSGLNIKTRNPDLFTDYTWAFRNDGTLTAPGAIQWDLNANSPGMTDISINKVGDNLAISTDVILGPSTWTFTKTGNLNLPGGAVIDTYGDGASTETVFWGAPGKTISVRSMIDENSYGGGIDIRTNGQTAIFAQGELSSAGWAFNEDGNLTLPGEITSLSNNFNDGFNLNVVASDNQGTVTFNFNRNGVLTFPDTSTYHNSTLTGAVDSDLALEVKYRPRISHPCYIGAVGEFVADIEFNDDIIAAGVGWTVVIGDTTYTVESVVEGAPANQFRLIVPGATFVSTETYTFTNPTPVSKVWTINSQNGTLIAPGSAILSNETADLGGGNTYRDFSIELPIPDGTNEKRWTFSNDGAITLPDNSVITSYKPVTVIANLSDDQTIPDNASASVLTLNALVESEPASLPGGIFSVPYTGYYQVNVSLYFTTSVTMSNGFLTVVDTTSGLTTLATLFYGSHTGQVINGSMMMPMTAGHTVAFAFRQVSGAPIDVSTNTRVTIHRVSIS
jgi:hypothetical protein